MNQIITGLTISSPTANTLTFDNSNFILSEIKGLESPLVRLPRFNLPGASGAFISNALYGERAIKIKGVVNAPDNKVSTYLANRTTLINALAYSRDNSGVLQPQTLMITLSNGQVLTTDIYVDTPLAMGFSEDTLGWEDFLVTMVAADPFLYSATVSSTLISLPVGGGTAIPTAIPISLAPSSGGNAVINNIGSTASFPIITLTAPLTNPYVTNIRTGEFLSFNYTISIGDADLIIDCANQTIMQGANDKSGIQSYDSTFWSILSGANTIAFSASGGSGNVTISYFPTFLGI
jgi:hypothetical protein